MEKRLYIKALDHSSTSSPSEFHANALIKSKSESSSSDETCITVEWLDVFFALGQLERFLASAEKVPFSIKDFASFICCLCRNCCH